MYLRVYLLRRARVKQVADSSTRKRKPAGEEVGSILAKPFAHFALLNTKRFPPFMVVLPPNTQRGVGSDCCYWRCKGNRMGWDQLPIKEDDEEEEG